MTKRFTLILFICLTSVLAIQAQTQAPDVSLKFGKGLRVTAADSSMYLKMGFRFQSLFNSERSLEDGQEWNSSFLVRRARLKFDGWALSPKLSYKVELALSNKDLKSSSDYEETSEAPKIILDAALKWKAHKYLEIWVGQAKLPGNRERVVSSQKLQLVDRSLVNSIFNIDREMGIQLRSKFKVGEFIIKPMASWSFGEGRNITDTNIGGYNYTGRMEFLPFGEFASKGDYFGSDLKREPKPKLAVGLTLNYNEGASRQKQSGRFLIDEDGNYLQCDMRTMFADMAFKYNGFSVAAEYAHKEIRDDLSLTEDFDSREDVLDADGRSYYTGSGFNVQAGYLFKNNIEITSRFTSITPDAEVSFTGQKEYTFGLSKYIVGHNLKLQTDVSLIDKDGTDINKLRYRLQMEFAF